MNDMWEKDEMMFSLVETAAYSPSPQPLADLKPILLSELSKETHHLGRVLIVRTFGHPRKPRGVENAIEQVDGSVDRLQINNTPPEVTAEEILPVGHVFAIKEPYYKATIDGGLTVRVDHPCNVVQLHPGHDLIPQEWQASFRSAQDYKIEGNAAIAKKHYIVARQRYTLGLEHCSTEEPALRCDLLRNRAYACLCTGAFEQAVQDAQAALIPVDDSASLESKTRDLNVKCLWRAGSASYTLRDFSSAKAYLDNALALNPDHEASRGLLFRTTLRIREQEQCTYDFDALHQQHPKAGSRVDCADYLVKTAVRQTPSYGRGLFATVDIAAGDIIMCEKAFAIGMTAERPVSVYVADDSSPKRMLEEEALLPRSLLSKLSNNPRAASQFLDLDDGGYISGNARDIPIVDDVPILDFFRVWKMAERNFLGCENLSTPLDPLRSICGVWIQSSYINHDCQGNSLFAFISTLR